MEYLNTPEGQAPTDNDIRLIEARTKQNTTYVLLAALLLLIVGGFVVFLLRGDSSFLSAVLGLLKVLIGGVTAYYFLKKTEKQE